MKTLILGQGIIINKKGELNLQLNTSTIASTDSCELMKELFNQLIKVPVHQDIDINKDILVFEIHLAIEDGEEDTVFIDPEQLKVIKQDIINNLGDSRLIFFSDTYDMENGIEGLNVYIEKLLNKLSNEFDSYILSI